MNKLDRLRHHFFTFVAKRMIRRKTDITPFHPLSKKLSECKVALVTTAGVHLQDQQPFNTRDGDWTYRQIPSTTQAGTLTISHTHYDTSEALKDINVVFPIERLPELVEQGRIGSVATYHYGFMGYIPDPKPLVEETAVQVARQLARDAVDIVILTPG